MMHQTEDFSYAEDGTVQVLELPYAGGDLAALVVLPRNKNGFAECERSLDSAALERWRAQLHVCHVAVTLPRFKFSSTIELKQTLRALGMKAAFDPKTADFSGVNANTRDLYIGAIFHEARVKVNESGTEAAAATAVVQLVLGARLGRQQTIAFVADHPFLFFIYSQRTGSLLFMGRVSDPLA